MERRPRVMFLCTHNSARSQMAEAFLRHYAGDIFEAHSAGLEATQVHPLTQTAMAEIGIDLAAEGHRSKSLIDEYLRPQVHLGYLITVCRKAEDRCPTYPGVGLREYWEIEDPATFEGPDDAKLDRFRAARDEIEARVKEFVARERFRIQASLR